MTDLHTREIRGLLVRKKQITFRDWIDLYEINISVLAKLLGISRMKLHHIASGKQSAGLEVAVQLHILSGYEIDMFSMMKQPDGEIVREKIEDIMGDLTKLNNIRISRAHALTESLIQKRKKNSKQKFIHS